ncbi:hypothetical protein VTN96DRAFT_4955 [Rasamsonia emersonii]
MAQACWPSAIVRMGHVAVPSTCHHDGCNPTQPGVCTAQTTLQQPTHRARSLVRACRDPEARGPTRLLGRALRFSIMRLYRWPPSHAKGPGGGEPDKPAAAVGLPVAAGDWQAAGRGRVPLLGAWSAGLCGLCSAPSLRARASTSTGSPPSRPICAFSTARQCLSPPRPKDPQRLVCRRSISRECPPAWQRAIRPRDLLSHPNPEQPAILLLRSLHTASRPPPSLLLSPIFPFSATFSSSSSLLPFPILLFTSSASPRLSVLEWQTRQGHVVRPIRCLRTQRCLPNHSVPDPGSRWLSHSAPPDRIPIRSSRVQLPFPARRFGSCLTASEESS